MTSSSCQSVRLKWIKGVGLFLVAISIVMELMDMRLDFNEMGNVDRRYVPTTSAPMNSEVNEMKVSNVYLQNQRIGTVQLQCPNGTCDIVKPEMNMKCPNMNGPTVIRKGSVFNLFVSGHVGGTNIRRYEATSLQGPWREATLEIPSLDKCASGLHSPDVVQFNGRYYMFAHLHGCQDARGKQPTIVLTSSDLSHWEFATTNYAAKEYFYTRVFVHNNVCYAIAKSQEDPVGSMVLLSSKSLLGPFTYVRTFARGVRHVSVHRKGDTLFVFFTLIGDLPERILLGVIDLNAAEWRLRPGPVILEPDYDGDLVPSKAGPAPCTAVPQLRDPFFVPDSHEGDGQLNGIIFFAARGELAIGAARLQINFTQLFDATRYRNHSFIDDLVFQSSSMSVQEHAVDRPLLITGVGRSGTTFVCDYLNRLGWNISHDNAIDCGPFPGAYGASSWYHAFQTTPTTSGNTQPLRVDKVVHLVRNPMATVKSRMARGQAYPHSLHFTFNLMRQWEHVELERQWPVGNDTLIASIMLRHWVHRNSFVSKHAQWRVAIEDLTSDPLHTWMLCLDVGRDECPALGVIRPILQSVDHDKNTNGKLEGALALVDDMTWWRTLAKIDEDAVRIALRMASEYGYKLENSLVDYFRVSTVKYSCQFDNDMAARSGREKPRQWGCNLVTQ